MPTNTIQILATDTLTSVFTATADQTQIYDMFVKNHDISNDVRLTMHHVKSGESASITNKFIHDLILADDNKPLFHRPVLATGDSLHISASITDQLTVFVSILEETL